VRPSYTTWLSAQGLQSNTVSVQKYRVERVEDAHGDIETHIENGTYDAVIDALTYSTDDERRDKPNPSKISITGNLRNNLASYRHAIEKYAGYLRDGGSDTDGAEPAEQDGFAASRAAETPARNQLIGLERDMQETLRAQIHQLEDRLEIIDEGAERSVASGFIDITARDRDGAIVVIELKTGTARGSAVAQVLGYMGDVVEEEPDSTVRGILVAGDFDKRAISAARMVPSLTLVRYSITFAFTPV
jgi:hypothetical protein